MLETDDSSSVRSGTYMYMLAFRYNGVHIIQNRIERRQNFATLGTHMCIPSGKMSTLGHSPLVCVRLRISSAAFILDSGSSLST